MLIFDKYLLMDFLCDTDAAIHNLPFSESKALKGPSRDTALSFRKLTAQEWLKSPKISIKPNYGFTIQFFHALMRFTFSVAVWHSDLIRFITAHGRSCKKSTIRINLKYFESVIEIRG